MRFAVLRTTELYFKDKPGSYMRMDFFDGESNIEAVQWAPQKELDYNDLIGKIVEAKGVPSVYKGKAQYKVEFLKIEEGLSDEEISKFIATSKRDKHEMIAELDAHIESIKNDDLREFVMYVFSRKDVAERFYNVSAAVTHHHAYRAGLLEHTLETVNCAKALIDVVPVGNADLVVAGAILHDLGKIFEYSLEGVTFARTDVGKEQGHISIGNNLICRYYERFVGDKGLDLQEMDPGESSEELVERAYNLKSMVQQLKHIILSHHGLKEWGSPVEPQSVEAVIVHHADLAPVRIVQMNKTLEGKNREIKLKEDRKKDLSIPLI